MDITGLLKEGEEIKQIKKRFNDNNLNHAFLVVSEDDLLSDAFVKCFCEVVLNDTAKVMAGVHSDVLSFPKNGNKSIIVADTEEIIEKSLLKPIEADNKVFVLKTSEGINDASQNKLLKIIEEPPKNLYIILQSRFDRSLLPTIRSRVNVIYLKPLSLNDFEKLGFDNLLYYKSGGSLTVASLLKENAEFAGIYNACLKALTELNSSKDILICSRKTLGKLHTETVLDIFTLIFSEIIKHKTLKNETCFEEISKKYSLKALAFIIDKINKAKQKVKFNCNNNAIIDCLLLEILEERYKWQQN